MLESGSGTHAQAQAKIHAQAHAVNRKHRLTGHGHFPGIPSSNSNNL